MRFRTSAAIVAVAVASVTIAGCGGGVSVPIAGPESSSVENAGSDPTNNAGAENPQAFIFESGILEIGDFEPYTLGDDIFDPCTEITPEEFAAAGFGEVKPIEEEFRGFIPGLNSCAFSRHDDALVENINNNDAGRPELEEMGLIIDGYRSATLPTLFVHHPKSGSASGCYAQVDTKRGGLVSTAGNLGPSNDQSRNCQVAIENLEALFLANSN